MPKFIKALGFKLNAIIILVLLVIHFLFKEVNYESSLFYYAFPLPVIICLVLCFSIFLNRNIRKYNLMLAAFLLMIWIGRSFKINTSEDIKATDLEVVFWNASHDRDFEEAFNLNNGIPDVLVLVEHGYYDHNIVKSKYSNYKFYKSARGISVFSKSALSIIEETGSDYKTNIVKFRTKGILFYVVDVSASIDVPRKWELGYVNNIIKEKERAIILGDFNVPYESVYFGDIKANFNHAFSKKGNGFRETWFWNIPLLSLDHIWVSKDLKILSTEKINTFKSDHSMLKTYVRK